MSETFEGGAIGPDPEQMPSTRLMDPSRWPEDRVTDDTFAETAGEVRGEPMESKHNLRSATQAWMHETWSATSEKVGEIGKSAKEKAPGVARTVGSQTETWSKKTYEFLQTDRGKRLAKTSGFTALAGIIGMRAKHGINVLRERRQQTHRFESVRKVAHTAKESAKTRSNHIKEKLAEARKN